VFILKNITNKCIIIFMKFFLHFVEWKCVVEEESQYAVLYMMLNHSLSLNGVSLYTILCNMFDH